MPAHFALDSPYVPRVVDHGDIMYWLSGLWSANECICEQNLDMCPYVPQANQVYMLDTTKSLLILLPLWLEGGLPLPL